MNQQMLLRYARLSGRKAHPIEHNVNYFSSDDMPTDVVTVCAYQVLNAPPFQRNVNYLSTDDRPTDVITVCAPIRY